MRILLCIIGMLTMAGGVLLLVPAIRSGAGVWLGTCGGPAAVVGGGVLLLAGLKGYRGHWPTVLGVLSIVLAAAMLGSDIDDRRAGVIEDLAVPLASVGVFLVAGVLLLYSGHKLHRCTLKLEHLRESLMDPKPRKAAGRPT